MTVWEASTPSKDIPGSEDMGSNQDLARRIHLLRRIDKWHETVGNLHTSFSDISEVMCFYLICTFSGVQENMPWCAWFLSYQIGFPGSASVKESTCMQKTSEIWVGSLDGEDPLEKNMATTPVFLLENPHGQRSLADYSPCGCKESNTTKMTKNELTSALVLRINVNTLSSIKSLFFPLLQVAWVNKLKWKYLHPDLFGGWEKGG